MKKKPNNAKKPTPRSLPIAKTRKWCESKGIDPDHLFTKADRIWEWAMLRRNLHENIALLDARFEAISEKRKICAMVVLFDGGPKQ
mgnify:CR=1 FL=1